MMGDNGQEPAVSMVVTGHNRIKPKQKTALKLLKRHYQIYLFILVPLILYIFIFDYIPMYGITMAFREFQFDKGLFFSPYVGFRYFKAFFDYYNWANLIKNTVIISFFLHILKFPIPIIFALMLSEVQSKAYKKIVQTITYMPNFISWIVVVILIQQFFGLEGLFNQLREMRGLSRIFYMNDQEYFYPTIFLSSLWKSFGMSSIIYVAALSNVDVELFDAAKVDGAGRLRRIWHISVPCLMPTAVMLFILGLGGILSTGYDQIYFLRAPGNAHLSEVLDVYLLDVGLREGQYGYAQAVGLMKSIIGWGLIFITNKVSKKVADISLF